MMDPVASKAARLSYERSRRPAPWATSCRHNPSRVHIGWNCDRPAKRAGQESDVEHFAHGPAPRPASPSSHARVAVLQLRRVVDKRPAVWSTNVMRSRRPDRADHDGRAHEPGRQGSFGGQLPRNCSNRRSGPTTMMLELHHLGART